MACHPVEDQSAALGNDAVPRRRLEHLWHAKRSTKRSEHRPHRLVAHPELATKRSEAATVSCGLTDLPLLIGGQSLGSDTLVRRTARRANGAPG